MVFLLQNSVNEKIEGQLVMEDYDNLAELLKDQIFLPTQLMLDCLMKGMVNALKNVEEASTRREGHEEEDRNCSMQKSTKKPIVIPYKMVTEYRCLAQLLLMHLHVLGKTGLCRAWNQEYPIFSQKKHLNQFYNNGLYDCLRRTPNSAPKYLQGCWTMENNTVESNQTQLAYNNVNFFLGVIAWLLKENMLLFSNSVLNIKDSFTDTSGWLRAEYQNMIPFGGFTMDITFRLTGNTKRLDLLALIMMLSGENMEEAIIPMLGHDEHLRVEDAQAKQLYSDMDFYDGNSIMELQNSLLLRLELLVSSYCLLDGVASAKVVYMMLERGEAFHPKDVDWEGSWGNADLKKLKLRQKEEDKNIHTGIGSIAVIKQIKTSLPFLAGCMEKLPKKTETPYFNENIVKNLEGCNTDEEYLCNLLGLARGFQEIYAKTMGAALHFAVMKDTGHDEERVDFSKTQRMAFLEKDTNLMRPGSKEYLEVGEKKNVASKYMNQSFVTQDQNRFLEVTKGKKFKNHVAILKDVTPLNINWEGKDVVFPQEYNNQGLIQGVKEFAAEHPSDYSLESDSGSEVMEETAKITLVGMEAISNRSDASNSGESLERSKASSSTFKPVSSNPKLGVQSYAGNATGTEKTTTSEEMSTAGAGTESHASNTTLNTGGGEDEGCSSNSSSTTKDSNDSTHSEVESEDERRSNMERKRDNPSSPSNTSGSSSSSDDSSLGKHKRRKGTSNAALSTDITPKKSNSMNSGIITPQKQTIGSKYSMLVSTTIRYARTGWLGFMRLKSKPEGILRSHPLGHGLKGIMMLPGHLSGSDTYPNGRMQLLNYWREKFSRDPQKIKALQETKPFDGDFDEVLSELCTDRPDLGGLLDVNSSKHWNFVVRTILVILSAMLESPLVLHKFDKSVPEYPWRQSEVYSKDGTVSAFLESQHFEHHIFMDGAAIKKKMIFATFPQQSKVLIEGCKYIRIEAQELRVLFLTFLPLHYSDITRTYAIAL